jgi:hypothetical protein
VPSSDDCLAWARRYRSWGYNCLPADPEVGHPLYAYAGLRDRGVPADRFALWRFSQGFLMVATGVRWNLVVVDLDGETATEVWRAWTLHRPAPLTWTVATPSGGRHLWFGVGPSVPVNVAPTRPLWELAGAKHERIDLLGDRALATAPPSVRVRDGVRGAYRWLDGRSPDDLSRPAAMPDWLAALACTEKPRPAVNLSSIGSAGVVAAEGRRAGLYPRLRYRVEDVKAAAGDKAAVAEGWGLRIVDRRRGRFLRCRAIGREDRHPSATFDADEGSYSDWGPRLYLPFFKVAEATGAYPDWRLAVNDLGDRLGVRPRGERRAS